MQQTGARWREWREAISARLGALRGSMALPGATILVLLVLLGGLPSHWALAGALALILWAMPWPHRENPLDGAEKQQEPASIAVDAGTPLLRPMLEAVPDPALLLDGRGRLLAANAAATTLFPDSDGREIALVNRAPELLAAVARAFSTKQAQQFDLHTVVPIDQHLRGLATPLLRAAQDPASPALVIVLRDRTAEQQLAEMRADFVANASHELRTPLASLKGFIETLQGAAKDDPVARDQFLPIMQEQANRMTRLIEDLLSLSRIEMHEHVPPSATVDVAEIVDSVAKSMQYIATKSQQRLVVNLIEQPAAVVGDRDELAQVVQNLVQNAIKYGRIEGAVTITVRRDGRHLVVSVADDGIGIAPEHLPRLTERFYRVSAKESRERGGTGLGLAIVKHIVNRHGGELRINSQRGQGSTFTVQLPTARRA